MCLGNLVIQIFHKIQPNIDTSVLFCVVQKIYKSRMPSTLQSLVLIFARLIQTNPTEIVELLSETSVDSRISLKVVLDKWLLQQTLFRGQYTQSVTLQALQKLFMMRDSRIESLMVIGFNPSHSNINSEVNAPFKILSTLLRFMDTEDKGLNKNTTSLAHRQPGYEDDEENKGESNLKSYQMERCRDLYGGNNGERLDTIEGPYDLYDQEDESDGDNDFSKLNEETSDEEGDLDAKPKRNKRLN